MEGAGPEAMTLRAKLRDIQSRLKCPKDQKSEEGWSFRSAEDIIANLRPLLDEHGLLIRFQEFPIVVGSWIYINCFVFLEDDEGGSISAQTAIREHPAENGRSSSQITGSAISYAHKAVLSDLFALDNSRSAEMEDPDRRIHHVISDFGPVKETPQYAAAERPVLNRNSPQWGQEVVRIQQSKEGREAIRKRICAAYQITRNDFELLLRQALVTQ